MQSIRRFAVDLVLTGANAGLTIPRRERGDVVFTGELGHTEVLRWIKGAQALVHAALREGFGLPLLEATRVGTPVICAQTSVPDVLREHVQDFYARRYSHAGARDRARVAR